MPLLNFANVHRFGGPMGFVSPWAHRAGERVAFLGREAVATSQESILRHLTWSPWAHRAGRQALWGSCLFAGIHF